MFACSSCTTLRYGADPTRPRKDDNPLNRKEYLLANDPAVPLIKVELEPVRGTRCVRHFDHWLGRDPAAGKGATWVW